MNGKKFAILNITPDSFSDGGLYIEENQAITHAKILAKHCYAIDIGAQSTRFDAKIVGYQEEIARLGNIIQEISHFAKTSIDSFHFETQKLAADQGATYINDVTGFHDQRIFHYAPSNVRFIFMHNLGVPPVKTHVMQSTGNDMIEEIKKWGVKKLREFQTMGLPSSRFIFDIGIGFGKTSEQSLYIINNMEKFADFETPIMVGHSRKSFMSLIKPDATIEERDAITKQMTHDMSQKGVEYFRIHNVL